MTIFGNTFLFHNTLLRPFSYLTASFVYRVIVVLLYLTYEMDTLKLIVTQKMTRIILLFLLLFRFVSEHVALSYPVLPEQRIPEYWMGQRTVHDGSARWWQTLCINYWRENIARLFFTLLNSAASASSHHSRQPFRIYLSRLLWYYLNKLLQ